MEATGLRVSSWPAAGSFFIGLILKEVLTDVTINKISQGRLLSSSLSKLEYDPEIRPEISPTDNKANSYSITRRRNAVASEVVNTGTYPAPRSWSAGPRYSLVRC